MNLTLALALTACLCLPLLAQVTVQQTEMVIEELLPIPGTKFVPQPLLKDVPSFKIDARTNRKLPTHQITVLRGEASNLPDIPLPTVPKPFRQGLTGELQYMLTFNCDCL